MARRIAIVEDEVALRENYAAILRKQGYEVACFGKRDEALSAFRERLPDLIILDIGLHDDMEGGFEICRELRSMSRTLPIMFLTARDGDFDTVSGLRLGADDYMTKDVTLPQLLARISALFRRIEALSAPQEDDADLQVGPLAVNTSAISIAWNKQPIDLTLTEFWIVHCLVRRPGHVKNRDQLMQDANVIVDDSTITSHIKRIRKKFKMVDESFDCIETVYGMGYRWNTTTVH
ncbi:MAG: proteobacterial dedicated sortase system response regulator [Gammaproteobacteria bacterium]